MNKSRDGFTTHAIAHSVVGAIPIPWLDERAQSLIQGSAYRRVARARGVRFEPGAREELTRPKREGKSGILVGAVKKLAARALAPLNIAGIAESGVSCLLRTALFLRYLEVAEERTIRDAGERFSRAEAARFRSALDAIIPPLVAEALRRSPTGFRAWTERSGIKSGFGADVEGRGIVERWTDAFLDGAADLPEGLVDVGVDQLLKKMGYSVDTPPPKSDRAEEE